MSETIPIDPVAYWKLRTRMVEHRSLVDRLSAQVAESKASCDAALIACGLDVSKPYRLDDATCAAQLVTPESGG